MVRMAFKGAVALCVSLLWLGSQRTFAQEGFTARTIGPPLWESMRGTDEGPIHRVRELTEVGEVWDAGAVYGASSSFPANPTNNRDAYRFDFKISQHVTTPLYRGNITYYINSADGSIAFTGEDNPALRERLARMGGGDKGEFHFGIRKADGNLLICGRLENVEGSRKRGMDIGKNRNVEDLWMESYFAQMQWLNDEGTVPHGEHGLSAEQLALVEDTHVTGRRAKYFIPEEGREQVLDLFLVNFPVPIVTSMPFMGLGVGVFKNFRQNINQLAIFSAFHHVPFESGAADLYFWLNSIHKAEATFNPGEYVVMTAFNQTGQQDIQGLTDAAGVFQVYRERALTLQRQLQECPEGQAGRDCRQRIQQQLKALEQELENKVKEFAEKHNIPMEKPRNRRN